MEHHWPDNEASVMFLKSVANLLKNDYLLLKNNAQERAITHKLAEYLQIEFPGWEVDCEYNRHLDKIKRRADGSSFNPDIIVHRRESDRYNLLVIEAKKSNGEDNHEAERLKEATSPQSEYRYQLGILIIFYVLDEYQLAPVISFFKRGVQIS